MSVISTLEVSRNIMAGDCQFSILGWGVVIQTNVSKVQPWYKKKTGCKRQIKTDEFAARLCLPTMISGPSVPRPVSFIPLCVHKVVHLAPSLLVNNWVFWACPFHTQSWYHHLLTMNQFTCGMFQTGVFGAFYHCPSLLLARPNFVDLWKCWGKTL